jgi:hypothetical protein
MLCLWSPLWWSREPDGCMVETTRVCVQNRAVSKSSWPMLSSKWSESHRIFFADWRMLTDADGCWRSSEHLIPQSALIRMTPPTTCRLYRYYRRMLTYADVYWRVIWSKWLLLQHVADTGIAGILSDDDVHCVCWRMLMYADVWWPMMTYAACADVLQCWRMLWSEWFLLQHVVYAGIAGVWCEWWRMLTYAVCADVCCASYARYADALLERTYRRASITDRPHAFSVCWRMLTYADVCLTQTTQMTQPRHTDTLTHTWANTWLRVVSTQYRTVSSVHLRGCLKWTPRYGPGPLPFSYTSPTLPLPFSEFPQPFSYLRLRFPYLPPSFTGLPSPTLPLPSPKEWYQPWYVDLIIRIKPFSLVFWSITDSW